MAHLFTDSSDSISRVRQALEVARDQAQAAQAGASPRLEDALAAIEGAISEHLGLMSHAVEADQADAEATGEAEHQRRAWYPVYRVA